MNELKYTFKQIMEIHPEISVDEIKKVLLKKNKYYFDCLLREETNGYDYPSITLTKFRELMSLKDKKETSTLNYILQFTVDPKSAKVSCEVDDESVNREFKYEKFGDLHILKSNGPISYNIYLEHNENIVPKNVRVESQFKRLSFMVGPLPFFKIIPNIQNPTNLKISAYLVGKNRERGNNDQVVDTGDGYGIYVTDPDQEYEIVIHADHYKDFNKVVVPSNYLNGRINCNLEALSEDYYTYDFLLGKFKEHRDQVLEKINADEYKKNWDVVSDNLIKKTTDYNKLIGKNKELLDKQNELEQILIDISNTLTDISNGKKTPEEYSPEVDYKKLATRLEELKTKFLDLHKHDKDLQNKLNENEKDFNKVKSDIEKLRNENKDIVNSNTVLTDENKDLKTQIKSIREDYNVAIDQLTTKNVESIRWDEERIRLENKIKLMEKEKNEVDEQYKRINQRYTVSEMREEQLIEFVTVRDNKIKELNKSITAKDNEIYNLNKSITAKDSEIKGLEADKKKLEDSNKSLEADKKKLEDSNKSLEADKKKLEDSNKSLEADKKKLEDSNKQLDNTNAQLRDDNVKLTQERDTAKEKLSFVNDTINNMLNNNSTDYSSVINMIIKKLGITSPSTPKANQPNTNNNQGGSK